MKKGIVAYIVTAVFVVANFFVVLAPETLASTNEKINRMDLKDSFCNGIGCEDGPRDCATAKAEISIKVKGYGEASVSVEYYCYEQEPTE